MKNSNQKDLTPEDQVSINYRKSILKAMMPEHWHRILAYLIDAPLLMIVAAILEDTFKMGKMDPFIGIIADLLMASFIYHVITEMSPKHASVGKMIMGMKIIRLDGKPLTFVDVLKRSFMRFFSWAFVGFSHLSVLLTSLGQNVHEIATQTMVVKNKKVQPTDMEQLGKTVNLHKPKHARKIRIALFAFNTFYFLIIALVAAGFAFVRQNVEVGYKETLTTRKYIEDYYRENQKFPPSLAVGPHQEKFNTEILLDVVYRPDNGALILKYDPKIGVKGTMYSKPVPGVYLDDPKKIIWVCGGNTEFIQSFLPNNCTTLLELQVEKINHAPSSKQK